MAILQNCTKAEVYDSNGTLLCPATVQSGPMDSILVITPDSLDHREHDLFRIVFYDPVLGVLTCRCELSAPLDLPDHMTSYRCEILERLNQEQRRQDVKVPLDMTVMLHAVYQPGDTSRMPEAGVPSTIVNISAGGVYLRAPLMMDKGRRVWFDFQIDRENVTLSAQVLRRDNAALSSNHQIHYGYGCKFINMLSKHEAALRSFIFELQRQQRKQD